MKATVHDSSIIIDLYKLGLLDHLFQLEIEIHITNNVLNELKKPEGIRDNLNRFNDQIHVRKFSIQELFQIKQHYGVNLSLADYSVIAYALEIDAVVVTSDQRLKRTGTEHGLECHGIIWILQLLLDQNVLSGENCVAKLQSLKTINPSSPKTEIDIMISRILNLEDS